MFHGYFAIEMKYYQQRYHLWNQLMNRPTTSLSSSSSSVSLDAEKTTDKHRPLRKKIKTATTTLTTTGQTLPSRTYQKSDTATTTTMSNTIKNDDEYYDIMSVSTHKKKNTKMNHRVGSKQQHQQLRVPFIDTMILRQDEEIETPAPTTIIQDPSHRLWNHYHHQEEDDEHEDYGNSDNSKNRIIPTTSTGSTNTVNETHMINPMAMLYPRKNTAIQNKIAMMQWLCFQQQQQQYYK